MVVEKGARVEDCVLFADCRVERGARVTTTVADDRSVFARDSVVGELPASRVVRDEEVTLVGRDSTVRTGATRRRRRPAGARDDGLRSLPKGEARYPPGA